MKVAKLEETVLLQYKWMEYLAYLLVFITPLYFSTSHWFPFNHPKTLTISAGVLLMTILFAWGAVVSKDFFLRINPLHIVLGFFVLILTLSSILGVDPHNSFFGIFIFPTNLIFIYLVSLFAILVGFLIKNNKNFLQNILLFSFTSSLIVSFFSYSGTSIFKILTDHSSTIGNSSYTGAYLMFNLFFGFGLFFFYKKYWKKILIALGILFILFCPLFFNLDILMGKIALGQIINKPLLLLGVANGAVLGIIVSIFVIHIFYLLVSSNKFVKIIGFIFLISFLFGAFYTSHLFTDPTSKIHNIYMSEKGGNRFLAWDIAKKSLRNQPLLGLGFNNFYYDFQKDVSGDIYEKNAEFLFQPHNVVWEYVSNTGILGFISYLSLLLFIFLSLFNGKDDEEGSYKIIRISLIGVLFGYFIQNLFVFDTVMTYLMLFLVVGIAMGLSTKSWNFEFNNKLKILKKISATILILVSLISILIFVILPWRESFIWRKSSTSTNVKELSSLRGGQQAISLFGGLGDSTHQANRLFNYYVLNINKVNDSNREFYKKEIDSLVSQIEKDQLSQPDNFRAYLIIGKLLSLKMYIMGNLDLIIWDKANLNLDKALLINNNNPEAHLAKAQLFINIRDYVEARKSLTNAITLSPNFKESYNIAKRLLKSDPNKEFEKFITEMEEKWVMNK